jgi:septum site-determining protein MinC
MQRNPKGSAVALAETPIFEFKGSSFTLPILRLLTPDLEGLARDLAAKVEKAPRFFRNAPVVIDLYELQRAGHTGLPLTELVAILRRHGMIPVGVRGGASEHIAEAEILELAVFANPAGRDQDLAVPEGPADVGANGGRAAAGAPEAIPVRGGLLVTQPVRSGQRVYARGGDLTIIATVGAGAEILADGNIHVYGSLRGRALAGVRGDTSCRIFCRDLRAELISIAGHYRVSEDLQEVQTHPVQVYFTADTLVVERLP